MNFLRKVISFFLILVVAVFIMGNARVEAQEGLSGLQKLLETEVTTASRSAEDISDAPATMRVVTEEQIEKRGYKDLKDIFRDLPGFDISENVSGEVRTLVMARGILGANKLLVLRDGKKINSPSGERFVFGNNHPLNNVKRIEVMYGPAAAMYGPDAYAGVVNMVTKEPEDIEGNAEFNFAYGTNNTLDFSGVVADQPTEDISYSINFRSYTSDGEDVLDNFSKDKIVDITGYSDVADFDANNPQGWEQPVKDYYFGSKLNVGNVTVGFTREDAEEPGGPSTGGFNEFIYDDHYVWHQVMNKLYVEHKASGKSYSLETSLDYSDYKVTPESGFMYSWGDQYKYAKTTSAKFESVLELDISEKTDFTGGIMVQQVNAFPKTNNLNSKFDRETLYDRVTYPDSPSIDQPYRDSTETFGTFDYRNMGIFADVSHSITDEFEFNLGYRYDYNTDYLGTHNPRSSLIWNPSDKTNVKLLYGQAYIQPSKYIAYEHWSAGTFGAYPNPDLDPEELTSYGLNASHYLTDNFKVGINTYLNKIESLHRTAGSPWYKNVASGEPESKGFELTFDYSQESFQSYLYYSYLDAEQDNGSVMNKVAENKINAGVTYDWDKVSFSPRIRWSGEKPRLNAAGDIADEEIDGHTVVDLDIRANELQPNLDVYLSVTNLLDEDYYAASPFGGIADGWVMKKAPQPGRNAEVGLTYKF